MKAWPRLDLDYAERRRPALPGLLLLGGVLAVLLVFGAHRSALERSAWLEAEIEVLQGDSHLRTGAQATADERRLTDVVSRANGVARELARPWDGMFKALESAGRAEVALLSIEPDMTKGVVRVSAEAKNKTAMLAYIARLRAQRPFESVLLEHHEASMQEAGQPLRFTLAAAWKGEP